MTDWHREGKLVGQREIALNSEGVQQAHAVAEALGALAIGEIICSPVLRAVQAAEVLANRFGASITRDPRLGDFRIGKWEGRTRAELAEQPEYRRFVDDPLNARLPGGEDLRQIRDRALGALAQALGDAPAGESLAVVTHSGLVKVLLCHYLGMDLASYARIRTAPGSISALSFRSDREPPRALTIGWRPRFSDCLEDELSRQ